MFSKILRTKIDKLHLKMGINLTDGGKKYCRPLIIVVYHFEYSTIEKKYLYKKDWN